MNEALLPSSISLVWTFHLFRVDSNIFSSLAHIQIVSREKCQNSYFPLYDPKIQTKLSNSRFWNFTWTEEGFSAFLALFSNLLIGNETRFWDSLIKHSYWRCDPKCFLVHDREILLIGVRWLQVRNKHRAAYKRRGQFIKLANLVHENFFNCS